MKNKSSDLGQGECSMKAIVKTKSGIGNVKLLDVPEPVCTPDSVKIEMKYAGVCGTDLHILNDTFNNNPPVVLGHEFSGIIVEVGHEVKDFSVGDRVTVLPSLGSSCETCIHCLTGNYAFCKERKGIGTVLDGGFTKYVVVNETAVYKIPDHLSLENAAMTEPLACAVQAIEELGTINIGDTVLVSGPGPIGLLCLSLLKMKGCNTLVAGTSSDLKRLAIASELGADEVINVDQQNLSNVIEQSIGQRGVDVVVECAGVPASINAGLEVIKNQGTYIQVGIVGKPFEFNFDKILYKQLSFFGSYTHSRKTWDRTMKIWEQNKIVVEPIITNKIPLYNWEEAFDLAGSQQGSKVLLYYSD